jgi:DNA replication protein DnaC
MITTLARAHAEGRLDDRLAFYAKPKLLIVDELGYLPFEPNAAHLRTAMTTRTPSLKPSGPFARSRSPRTV